MAARKRPKSPSEGFGTNRRCPSRSIGPPRLDKHPRLAHRPIAAHGVSERGGKQRPSQWKLVIARAERFHDTWVGALSRGAASDAHASTGKTEPAFQSAESALPVLDRPKSRACAVLAPTRC